GSCGRSRARCAAPTVRTRCIAGRSGDWSCASTPRHDALRARGEPGCGRRSRMYLPKHFEENRVQVLHDLIRAHPLGALVAMRPSGLEAEHIPLEIDPEPAPFGTLRGHIARANPLWREVSGDPPVLAIFQGPGNYVSPSWYVTKKETGKVVPTWNYAVVHGHGTL